MSRYLLGTKQDVDINENSFLNSFINKNEFWDKEIIKDKDNFDIELKYVCPNEIKVYNCKKLYDFLEGDNYNENVGEINDGKDYEKNERNIYDLYIPQYALDRKNEINGIILWIHGGAWMSGTKEEMDPFCKLYSQQGYISATVQYTLLNSTHKDFNIFKMLDEITACIKAIKINLVKKGFAGDKLKLVIGGISSGAHLALLYSYLIKKVEIPIQFIINYVGPIGVHSKYFYGLNSKNETLPNIEKVETIEQAMKDGKIKPMMPDINIIGLRNLFLGNKYSKRELFDIATTLEGHPDNVAPAIYGGLVASYQKDNKYYPNLYPIHKDLKFSVIIPEECVSTQKARGVLPKELSIKDIVWNMSRIVNIPRAFSDGDIHLLKDLFSDRLHEPYRSKLIKDYDTIKNLIKDDDVAFAISGSGSTMLMISKDLDFIPKLLSKGFNVKTLTVGSGVSVEELKWKMMNIM